MAQSCLQSAASQSNCKQAMQRLTPAAQCCTACHRCRRACLRAGCAHLTHLLANIRHECAHWRHAQVNAALDDAASMAEDLARQLSAARSKGRLTAAERKRTQALMVSVAVRPELMPNAHTSMHSTVLGLFLELSARLSRRNMELSCASTLCSCMRVAGLA